MPNPMLTPAQASSDVALMRRAMETIHPGLYRYVPKAQVDASFARLEAQAKQPTATLTLHREIARMVASIHCDHSKPELPDAIESWRKTNASHLPFRFRLIEGRMIVASGALPKGAEITAINGRPVPQILSAVAPLVAHDGDTDQAIAVKIADDSDLGGSDLEEYWPGLFGAALPPMCWWCRRWPISKPAGTGRWRWRAACRRRRSTRPPRSPPAPQRRWRPASWRWRGPAKR